MAVFTEVTWYTVAHFRCVNGALMDAPPRMLWACDRGRRRERRGRGRCCYHRCRTRACSGLHCRRAARRHCQLCSWRVRLLECCGIVVAQTVAFFLWAVDSRRIVELTMMHRIRISVVVIHLNGEVAVRTNLKTTFEIHAQPLRGAIVRVAFPGLHSRAHICPAVRRCEDGPAARLNATAACQGARRPFTPFRRGLIACTTVIHACACNVNLAELPSSARVAFTSTTVAIHSNIARGASRGTICTVVAIERTSSTFSALCISVRNNVHESARYTELAAALPNRAA